MILAVGGLAVVLLGIGAAAFWYERPTVLTVAVSQADTDDMGLMNAVATQLKRGRKTIRLRIIPAINSSDASSLVESGKAELAVVRTDIAIPGNAQTVVILHRDAAIMVAPASGDVKELSDLAGHRIGIVENGPGNKRLLEIALAQNDMREDSVAVDSLEIGEVAEAIRSKRVDAVMMVDTVSSLPLHDLVKAVMTAGGGPPVFLSVAEAGAIAQRSSSYDSSEIVRGAFGGAPPRPADEFDTLSVTHRLVATETLDDNPITELTRFLLSERTALASAAPVAARIEAPSTDKGSALPVHPGAAAYIDDEEETFFDKYSDFIYIGAMMLGVLASGATALMSRMNSRRAAVMDESVGRMVEMLAAARAARTALDLDALQAEADHHLASALETATSIGDEARLRVFSLALNQVRAAIRDRRRDVGLGGQMPVANDAVPASAAAE